MSLTQQEFNERLKDFSASKIPIKILLSAVQLKEKYFRVLWLKYIDEKSYFEIADEMNLVRQSVSNLVCVAKKELKKALERSKLYAKDDVRKLIADLLNDE